MTDPHIESAQSLCWETNTWTGSGEGRHNEDFALIDQDGSSAVLVDGATGLTKANLVAGTSDAAWFAHTFCAELSAAPSKSERAAVSSSLPVMPVRFAMAGARVWSNHVGAGATSETLPSARWMMGTPSMASPLRRAASTSRTFLVRSAMRMRSLPVTPRPASDDECSRERASTRAAGCAGTAGFGAAAADTVATSTTGRTGLA